MLKSLYTRNKAKIIKMIFATSRNLPLMVWDYSTKKQGDRVFICVYVQ